MKKVMDNIYHHEWDEAQTMECQHPAAVKRYGHSGKCVVPIYTCFNCKYAIKFPFFGGVKCGYHTGGDEY